MFDKVPNTPLVNNVQLCSNPFHLSVVNVAEHTHTHTQTQTLFKREIPIRNSFNLIFDSNLTAAIFLDCLWFQTAFCLQLRKILQSNLFQGNYNEVKLMAKLALNLKRFDQCESCFKSHNFKHLCLLQIYSNQTLLKCLFLTIKI